MSTTETETIDAGAEGRPSHSRYPRLDKWFTETPWAITRAMFDVVCEIRTMRLAGIRLTQEEIDERIEAAKPEARTRQPRKAGAIAVVPLYGVIIPKANALTQMSGGMTLQDFRGMLKAAVADPDVSAILLDVDSPGGSVDLVPEAAADVRSAARSKPLWAIANTDCYSAAYWIATQASQLWVTPSGGVGSVGCYAVHEDWSGFNDKAGIQPTYISYGEHKTDGNPDEPLSDDARSKIQSDVNTYGEMFVADVAKGRGVNAATVRKTFGQGATVLAKDAVAAGMADRVGTFEQAVAEMSREVAASAPRTEALDAPESRLIAPTAPVTSEDEPDTPDETEPDEPAEAALVEGAERLLGRDDFRSLMTPTT